MSQRLISVIRKLLPDIIICILFGLIIVSANFSYIKNYQMQPPHSKYYGAGGFYFDYYQILSWMRDGANGQLFISSRYIPEKEPEVLLYPLFTITGFVGSRLGLPIDITYHLIRNIFLVTWLVSLCFLVKKVFPDSIYRKFAYIGILMAGGFPVISITPGAIRLLPFIDFWNTFYALEKFIIPAHHLLANTLFILLLITIIDGVVRSKDSVKHYLPAIICAVILTFVNPASMTLMIIILAVVSVYTWIALVRKSGKAEENVRFLKICFLVALSVVPVFLYNLKLFESGNPWKYYYLGEKIGRYMVTYGQYIGSLGPFIFTAMLSLIFFPKFSLREIIFITWIILPVVMFPFVGRQIPFSMSRLFSMNVFIPSAIMTVYAWEKIRIKWKNTQLCGNLFIIFIILSALPGFVYSLRDVFGSYTFHNLYNVYIPDDFSKALEYVNGHSVKGTTVIAGENLSNVIPALTDNHVVLGRLDAYPNYQVRKNEVDEIYNRWISDEKILTRLGNWRVQYIIFGIDQIGYEEFTKRGQVKGITKVFESGNIVVAEVK